MITEYILMAVRGHVPRENFERMVQFGAIWCNFVSFGVYFFVCIYLTSALGCNGCQ